jgi:hypothetical protein
MMMTVIVVPRSGQGHFEKDFGLPFFPTEGTKLVLWSEEVGDSLEAVEVDYLYFDAITRIARLWASSSATKEELSTHLLASGGWTYVK